MKNNTTTTVITKHNRENKPSSRVTMIINITIIFSIICADSPRRCDHGMGYQSGARGNVSILKIIFHKQSMTKSVEAKATCHRHHHHLTYSIPFFFQQRRPTSRPATKSHGGGGRGCTRGQSQGTYPFFGGFISHRRCCCYCCMRSRFLTLFTNILVPDTIYLFGKAFFPKELPLSPPRNNPKRENRYMPL